MQKIKVPIPSSLPKFLSLNLAFSASALISENDVLFSQNRSRPGSGLGTRGWSDGITWHGIGASHWHGFGHSQRASAALLRRFECEARAARRALAAAAAAPALPIGAVLRSGEAAGWQRVACLRPNASASTHLFDAPLLAEPLVGGRRCTTTRSVNSRRSCLLASARSVPRGARQKFLGT